LPQMAFMRALHIADHRSVTESFSVQKRGGAVQAFGDYWRLGANESTELTIDKTVLINGQTLIAGTYKVYAYPGKNDFEIAISTDINSWGAMESDPDLDLFRTTIPVQWMPEITEQHTLSFVENGVGLQCEFEHARFMIPTGVK